VPPEIKRRARLIAGGMLVSAALVVLCFWAVSKPRSPLAYMVAGTLTTSILLAAAFVQIVKRGYLMGAGTGKAARVIRRTARKNERSS
jgi:phage tail tape-measure protein